MAEQRVRVTEGQHAGQCGTVLTRAELCVVEGRNVTSPTLDASGRVPIVEEKHHHRVQLDGGRRPVLLSPYAVELWPRNGQSVALLPGSPNDVCTVVDYYSEGCFLVSRRVFASREHVEAMEGGMTVAGSWARLHPDASEVWRDGGEAGPADPTREAAQLLLKEGQKFLEVEHKELLVTVPAGCSEGQKFCMQSPHGGLFNFTVRAGVSAGQQMRVRVPAQRPLTLEVVGDMLSRQQPDAEETAAEAERLWVPVEADLRRREAGVLAKKAQREQWEGELSAAKVELTRAEAEETRVEKLPCTCQSMWARYNDPVGICPPIFCQPTCFKAIALKATIAARETVYVLERQLKPGAVWASPPDYDKQLRNIARERASRDVLAYTPIITRYCKARDRAREEAIVSPFLPLGEMFIVRDICATCGECLELEQLLLVSHYDLQPLTTEQVREPCRCHCPIDHSFMCEHVREQVCAGCAYACHSDREE